MDSERREHLARFYSILDHLEHEIGGERKLADCLGRMEWPARGVYFFREVGEVRSDTGTGSRIVRVGTHALKDGSGTKLWTRLSQHRGQANGGGNHRGSIFRLIVGTALIRRDKLGFPTWGTGNTAKAEVRSGEHALERKVSDVIGKMSFIWLPVGDEPGPDSRRGYIERNAIALLSNYGKAPPIRPRSTGSGTIPTASVSGIQVYGIKTTSMKSAMRPSSTHSTHWFQPRGALHDRSHPVRREETA